MRSSGENKTKSGVSRRAFFRGEIEKGKAVGKDIPGIGKALGSMLRERPQQRKRRLLVRLWETLTNRTPAPHELKAAEDLMEKSHNAEEVCDTLVDVAWALTRTTDFAEANWDSKELTQRIYRFALSRKPRPDELERACALLDEVSEIEQKGAVVEGMLGALLRGPDSIVRRP